MNDLLRKSKMFLNRNSATILSVAGGVGVVATTVMAVKATPKAIVLIEEATEEKGEKLTALETIIAAGPVYIPAVIVGVSTVACIFGANILNKRKQASLMSAYALIDSSYKEYRNKVNEMYGEEADSNIRKEIAKDKYEESNVSKSGEKQLFYDMYSSRYFESTMEAVQKAEYKTSTDMLINCGTTVNTFYNELGLPHEDAYDELGWAWSKNEEMFWVAWMEFTYEPVLMDDGLECIIINMPLEPYIEFLDL